ncbi:McrB family protein [Streptomyces millisiae]|uniref:AAA family ATPase n=1 Tax=Streptomyces millisiae TaxID=3075542 RepID=A0ABU2LVD8_9ACTN|nr:AAA family ATPase [Streptomyces sp. DSM 44918]MDT0321549.1 AAA family ATPase [Streptomyces sp. DSM 44918]
MSVTVRDVRARAAYQALRVLAEQPDGQGLPFRQLWPRVRAADPELERDWELAAPADAQPLPVRLRYDSINFGSGWLRKEAGKWWITGAGRLALRAFPEPGPFFSEAMARYGYWREHQQAFSEAALLLKELDGQWVALPDLATHCGLDEGALAEWLQGQRPQGWHLALTARGEVPRDVGLWPADKDAWRRRLSEAGLFDESASSVDVIRVLSDRRLPREEVAAAVEGMADLATEARPRRAWLIRGEEDGRRLIRSRWAEESICSLSASRLPHLSAGASLETVQEVVNEAYSARSGADRAGIAAEFHTFLSRMREGDIVVATDRTKVYVGTVRGPARQRQDPHGRPELQRPITWRNLEAPLDFFEELPAGLTTLLSDPDANLVDLSDYLGDLESRLGEAPEQPTTPTGPPELPDATPELARRLCMPEDSDWLQQCVELLRDKPQLIFSGPPGTGKTYTALALAEHLTGGNPENTTLVQFHPAYSYEDFFEGFRPRTAAASQRSGAADKAERAGLAFDLVPGPFKRLAKAAQDHPAQTYVLVIDEINRGNLAKIFGELYFLLEYRDRSVRLLYGSDGDRGFYLPRNLYILATMNSADRSIALMDQAMRRRFSFRELHPNHPPVDTALRIWLEQQGLPQHAFTLLNQLNELISQTPAGDEDFRIGPSYFMRREAHASSRALRRVWEAQILPALTEYHWGDTTDVAERYALDAVAAQAKVTLAELDQT